MGNRPRSFITLLIALAFAAGLAGSGCKRARSTNSANENAGGLGISRESSLGASLEKSAAQSVSPTELARKELSLSEDAAATVAHSRPKPLEPMCYVEAFHHQPTPGDTDEESSSHHKNLMTLAHSNVNPAHVCVRVNGIPVKFSHKVDRGGDQILIGAIAGPSAKITVSYCVGKLICPEVSRGGCAIPKDEFMDALSGGASDDGDDAPAAQWEGTDAKLNADVKKELSDIDGMGSEDSGEATARGPASLPIFKGWIKDQAVPACPKQAS